MGDRRRVAYDFPGLRIGVASDEEGPTGCTVLVLDRPAALAVDARGGIPGLHRPDAPLVEAICLAGGSILGLEAVTGVASELYASRGRDPHLLPAVSGGVIYDFSPPGRSGVHPDAALGRVALHAAEEGVAPVGQVGAARSATCGKIGRAGWSEPGGQGVAAGKVGAARVVVLTVVNALGVVVDRAGEVVRGNRDPATGRRGHISADDMAHGLARQRAMFTAAPPQATTLTVVVTDARLRRAERTQLGRQVHASLARAIHPFHCTGDGDALWFASTGEVEAEVAPTALGVAASELAWDAVLTAVADDRHDVPGTSWRSS